MDGHFVGVRLYEAQCCDTNVRIAATWLRETPVIHMERIPQGTVNMENT